MIVKDLTGFQVGKLTVLSFAGKAKDGHAIWNCVCSCGTNKNIISNSLTRKSPVQSCGCRNKEVAQLRNKTVWNTGRQYIIGNGEHVYKTRHAWAKACIKYYGNKCKRCGWDKARCDVHHKQLKSEGGEHTIENGMVLCPNCHRIDHQKGKK